MIDLLLDSTALFVAATGAQAPVEVAVSGLSWDHRANNVLYFVSNLGILFICLGMVLCVWRVLRGPTLVDRAIAGDLLAIHVVAFVILATINFQSLVLFDAVLIISILGFVSTVATAQYIARRGTAT